MFYQKYSEFGTKMTLIYPRMTSKSVNTKLKRYILKILEKL